MTHRASTIERLGPRSPVKLDLTKLGVFVTQTYFASKCIAGSNGMECRDVDDYFCDGLCQSGAVIPMDVARHLIQCEACHALYQRLRPACRRVRVPPELQSRILGLIQTSLRLDTAHGRRK
jgi:hypothetical protein